MYACRQLLHFPSTPLLQMSEEAGKSSKLLQSLQDKCDATINDIRDMCEKELIKER